MQLSKKIILVIGLIIMPVLVHPGEITDTYSTGDTLTADALNNIKSAVNDNDARVTTNETNIGANSTSIGDNISDIVDHESRISVLEAQKTRSVVIPAMAFVPEDSGLSFATNTSNGALVNESPRDARFIHYLPVPEGATITGVEAYVVDDIDTDRISVEILRVSGLSQSTIVSVATTDAQVGCNPCTMTSTPVSHEVILSVDNHYSVQIFMSQGSPSLGAFSVKVDFTYTP